MVFVNMYDFILANSSFLDQVEFGDKELFIDYVCPITEKRQAIWSHKNCLMLVIQGKKSYESLHQNQLSQKNDVLFIRKGGYIVHQYFEQPYHALIFMFDDTSIQKLLHLYPNLELDSKRQSSPLMEKVVWELDCNRKHKNIFLSSLDYLSSDHSEIKPLLELKFMELMLNLIQNKENNSFYNYLCFLMDDRKAAFIKLMNDNCHLYFTASELARTANMSLSTFKRNFKKYMGSSPGKWLREQRISRAKDFLNQGRNISDLAFELGYSDPASFSKSFKKSVGCYPSEYAEN